MSISVADDVVFPVYVFAKDCGEISRYDHPRDLNRLEAIDVENNEYDAWDAEARLLRLSASNIGVFRSGDIAIATTGQSIDTTSFKKLTEVAVKS